MITPDETNRPPRERRSKRGHHGPIAALAAAGAIAVLVSGCGAAAAETTPAPPVPNPDTSAALSEGDVNAWLDGLVPAALEETGIAGASVSVVHDGELLTARGYGYSDTGTGDTEAQPVDPDETLFRVGSVSKLFTATAAMQLVEAGDLDLDTDVEEYIDFTLPRSFDEDITLRHLLTHTAGFEERLEGMILPEGSEVNLRERLATDPPEQVYEPGTVPAYSNYGNALVGLIVEQTSQMPFEEYVDQNVLDPIGMDSSTFEQPLPEDLAARLSNGYANDDGPPQPFETVAEAPAGALTASATDMARFMLAHLGDLDSGETSLLEPETLALMHEPALDGDTLGTIAEGPRMTLGFFEESRNGHRIIGHGGDTNVFHTHMQIYPEEGTGVFITLNSSGHEGTSNLNLRDLVMNGFTDRYFPGEEPGAADEPTAREHAQMAEGSYLSSRSMHSNFLSAIDIFNETRVSAREDGTIVVEPGPETGRPTVYEEIEPWVWREVGGDRMLTMRVADDQVQEIGFASAFTLLRADPVRSSAVALPILVFSMSVLVITALSWPIGAVIRRRRSLPKRDPAGRWARVLTRVGVAANVAAFIGWVAAIITLMGLQDIPSAVLVLLLILQSVGVLGIFPAAVALFNDVRRKAGWKRYVGSALILAALIGIGWFANAFNLVAPNVSY